MSSIILIEQCVGQTRAVAFNDDGKPISLFLDRWCERGTRAAFGQTYRARLRKLAPKQGGGFAELEHGEDVFLRTPQLKGVTEGASFFIKILAEGRRGKIARGRRVDRNSGPVEPFQHWRSALPDSSQFHLEERLPGDGDISAAFDEAMQARVSLPGGGTIHISETPALIAIDVDTSGRSDSGRSYDRALKINQVAAETAARQLCLRGLGGLCVLDCVSPLTRETGDQVKKACLAAFRACTTRSVEVLRPSPFGLLQVSSAWSYRPIGHAVLNDKNKRTDLSEALDELRQFEKQLIEKRASAFKLKVPIQAHAILDNELSDCIDKLSQKYGARFEVIRSQCCNWEIAET